MKKSHLRPECKICLGNGASGRYFGMPCENCYATGIEPPSPMTQEYMNYIYDIEYNFYYHKFQEATFCDYFYLKNKIKTPIKLEIMELNPNPFFESHVYIEPKPEPDFIPEFKPEKKKTFFQKILSWA